jgi:hypothetical protein
LTKSAPHTITSTHSASNTSINGNRGLSYYSPMTGTLRTTPAQTGLGNITVTGISPPVNPESYFMYQLGYSLQSYTGNIGNSASSLGYCNVGYRVSPLEPDPNAPVTPVTLPTITEMGSLDWTNFDGFGPPYVWSSPNLKGAPARIAGMVWLNRPFASPYELAMVPLTGPGLFGLHHSAYQSVMNREQYSAFASFQTTNAWDVALSTTPTTSGNPLTSPSLRGYWATPEPLASGAVRVADWPLLLEMVETQAPFIDAEHYYNPVSIGAFAGGSTIGSRFLNSFLPSGYTIPDGGPSTVAVSEPSTVRGPSLMAPFNFKSTYVAAGKINLNTVAFDSSGQSRALKAIEHNYLATERGLEFLTPAASNAFQASRQGFAPVTTHSFFPTNPHPAMHPEFPTRFVGAFRPAMTSNIAPSLATPAATAKMRSRYGVESTLLRSASIDVNLTDAVTLQSPAGPLASRPMLYSATPGAAGDELEATQPFIRMQRAMRLPNLVTNQSNVFAVWVTVSLFEYDPIAGFGNEYIADNGLPERERHFSIVDRSIPVGYKPGESLNAERTILLRSKLP